MPLDPGTLQPIARADGRRTAVDVYESLRQSILSGRIKPGTILSQVEVARALEVSRTPVREAMRMLQEAGLVSSEPNLRSQVLGFDPTDIEALYMKRIMLEAFGVSLTTRRMTPQVLRRLEEVIEALEGEDSHASFATWQELHRDLHSLIVCAAGDPFAADMRELELRSARYQSAYKGENPAGWWQRGETEHRQMFEAMRDGNAPLAGQLAARHLARTALEVLAALAPEHDTSKLRASLSFAIAAVKAC
jgi:DNA-binding GntR family transcriptional regulator